MFDKKDSFIKGVNSVIYNKDNKRDNTSLEYYI